MYLASEFNLDKKENYQNFTIAYNDYCCSFGLTDDIGSGGLILLVENKDEFQQLIEGINFLKEKGEIK